MLFKNIRTGTIIKPVNKDVVALLTVSDQYEPYKPTKGKVDTVVKADAETAEKPADVAQTADTEPKPAKGKK